MYTYPNEIIQKVKQDEEAEKFARLQKLDSDNLKKLVTEPGDSLYLLYAELIWRYIYQTEEAKKARELFRKGSISKSEVIQKENELLVELLSQAGLYATAKA